MNVDALLQPISPGSPCGEDLSFSVEFDAIVEKRREDDPTLDQGEWVRALKVADWPGVVAACEELLIRRTKDVRVIGWWTDAATRVRGLAAMADGLEVCERLCAERWHELHPRAAEDDGDLAERIGSLAWLLGQLPELSRLAPAPTAGAPRRDDGRRGLAALEQLQRTVDARLGADGPGFGPARAALEEALDRVARPLRVDASAPGPGEAVESSGAGGAAGSVAGDGATGGGSDGPGSDDDPGAPSAGRVGGPPATRAQALQQLREVAGFFRRTEPHSPVAYLADKAARWGEMPLHAWLKTVLKDSSALAHLEELLGIEPPPSSPPT